MHTSIASVHHNHATYESSNKSVDCCALFVRIHQVHEKLAVMLLSMTATELRTPLKYALKTSFALLSLVYLKRIFMCIVPHS
jgi:hypothetical protein